MMLPTHVMTGLVLIIPLLHIFPDYSSVIVISTVVANTLPDADIVLGEHRKTLHYPVISTLYFVLALILLILLPGVLTVLLFTFMFGIFFHSVVDIIGGSLEDEPWKETKEKVVYNHFKDRWFSALRIVRYDGSPEDLFLLSVFSGLFFLFYPNNITTAHLVFVGITVVIGIFYTVFRKTLFSPVYMEENHPQIKSINDIIR